MTLKPGESSFQQPDKFIPERWTTQPELVKHQGASAPFSTGPYGCIGRPLALLSLRTTTAQLLHRFDIDFAPGSNPSSAEGDAIEHFTLAPGSSMMVFKERTTQVAQIVN